MKKAIVLLLLSASLFALMVFSGCSIWEKLKAAPASVNSDAGGFSYDPTNGTTIWIAPGTGTTISAAPTPRAGKVYYPAPPEK